MTVYSLYDNFVGPPGAVGPPGIDVTEGSAFSVSSGAGATGIRWYAVDSNTAHKPSALDLWDGVSGSQLAHVTTITHPGTIGWHTVALGAPVQLTPGRRYVVSMTIANGSSLWGRTSTNAAATPPLQWAATPAVTANGASTYPNTPLTNIFEWVDVVADDTQGAAGGTGTSVDYSQAVQAASQALNSWLSTTGNDFPAISTPYLNKALLDALTTAVGNVPKATDDPWTAAVKLWQIAGALTDLEIAAWNTFAQRAPGQLTGGSGGGGSAFFASGGRQVAQAASDTLDVAQLLLALRRNALVDFPGAPWVMADETAFSGDIAYAQEADMYVVTFTDLGSNIVNTVAAGVDVSYRLAWWTPLIGAFAQQRRFIDTPSAHLWLDGTRLPGVLLHSPAGAAGTIQAWLYA